MTWSIAILFLIIAALVVLLALEVLPADTLSVSLMVTLILCGFVSPAEGISGLSNEATVTVLALMILTVGLETTGVITALARRMKRWLTGGGGKITFMMMSVVGTCSAFISSTAVVIVFMRIMIKLSRSMPTSLSKLLMPLSFAGILGGSCTLLGTSTNLLVSSIATDYEVEPFSVFEFTHLGVIFFAAGLLYMVLIGRYLIPDRRKGEDDLTEEYSIRAYLTEVIIPENSPLVGRRVDDTAFFQDNEIDLLEIRGKDSKPHFPSEVDTFQAGDFLLVKGTMEKVAEMREKNELTIIPRQSLPDEDRMNTEDMTLCEVVVRPNSRLVGSSLDKVDIRRDYNAVPLAVKKNQKYYSSELDAVQIEPGDILLMEVAQSNFERFYNLPEFIVLQEHEELAAKSSKRYLAGAIIVVVILLAAFSVLPILVSALAGCVAMFLTGCLDLQKAYRRVNWGIIFLLAGVIPLGTAMDNTGASEWIANTFVDLTGTVGPHMVVGALFLVSVLLSSIISNNATAVLMAPIAVSIAGNLGFDPRPLLFTVMFAANMSFVSPIGYQTNTLIYGPGEYHFVDFVKVGGFLTLIVWALATWLIPVMFM